MSLQKHLKLEPLLCGESLDLFFCWELHIIRFHDQNTLVAVNASNRFAVVLWGMKVKDWNMMEKVVLDAIRKGFSLEGYSAKQIDNYFEHAGETVLTKTHGYSVVGALNKMTRYMNFLPYLLDSDTSYQEQYSHEVNRDLCHAAGFEYYDFSIEFLALEMNKISMN